MNESCKVYITTYNFLPDSELCKNKKSLAWLEWSVISSGT